MGRLLKGQVVELPSGRLEASLPESKGSRIRRREYFDTDQEADDWRWMAVACVESGVPIPPLVQGSRVPIPPLVPVVSLLEDLARRWHHRVYCVEQRAQPKRGDQVLRQIETYILGWFVPRWPMPGDTNVADCHEFMHFLAGRRDIDGNLTLGAAAVEQEALAESTAGGLRKVLCSILDEGVAERILDRNVAFTSDAAKPVGVSHKRQVSTATAVPLRDAAQVAGNMHALHQLALWIQRINGPRVGEAYGPRVGEIVRDGDYGIYVVDSQSGQNYQFWNEFGEREITTHIDRLKTSVSYRIMVLCPSLMALVDLIVKAFHTNPDGTLNIGVPLIPGIHAMDGGIAGYTSALNVAVQGLPSRPSSLRSGRRSGLRLARGDERREPPRLQADR